jgi:hypothetical protein
MLSAGSVVLVGAPGANAIWDYVVTTANARISVRTGRRGVPGTVGQGAVFEVLGRHPLGSTLYILLENGRTAEIASNLVRTARPEERPPPPAVGRLPGRVLLGCEISIDGRRNVYVDFIYPGSLGQRLGLQPETRIIKVNGHAIHSAADYDRASSLLGGNLRLLVQRPGLDYPEMLEYVDPRNVR